MSAVTAIHRFPHDTRKHALSVECWCTPVEKAGIWVHRNSADVKRPVFKGWDDAIQSGHNG